MGRKNSNQPDITAGEGGKGEKDPTRKGTNPGTDTRNEVPAASQTSGERMV